MFGVTYVNFLNKMHVYKMYFFSIKKIIFAEYRILKNKNAESI